MFAKDFIFTFHFANKQGVSAIFSTSNSGESTIFSSGQRPWIISKMWLYVYLPSCAVALSQVTTSQRHRDTSNLAFSTSPDMRHVYCSFFRPAARSPPKSGHAFNHCKLTGSELLDTKAFLDLIFNLLVPKGQMINAGRNVKTHTEIHNRWYSHP